MVTPWFDIYEKGRKEVINQLNCYLINKSIRYKRVFFLQLYCLIRKRKWKLTRMLAHSLPRSIITRSNKKSTVHRSMSEIKKNVRAKKKAARMKEAEKFMLK